MHTDYLTDIMLDLVFPGADKRVSGMNTLLALNHRVGDELTDKVGLISEHMFKALIIVPGY